MKTVSYWVIFCCFILTNSFLSAQKGTVSAGGDASGSGGSVSFSIGQIDYLTPESSGGKINQGLQVPYEILVETGLGETSINIQAEVFPNPTEHYVFLQVQDWKSKELTYDLFELQGKLLRSEIITEERTILELEAYSASVYLLHIRQGQKTIKTFRIIKK
jgi:hypothetical protein